MKTTYISDRGNNDVRIMWYDAERDIFIESDKLSTITEAASKLFFHAYHAHPSNDRALALDSARETVSAALPDGVAGEFDDEYLTFFADGDDR